MGSSRTCEYIRYVRSEHAGLRLIVLFVDVPAFVAILGRTAIADE